MERLAPVGINTFLNNKNKKRSTSGKLFWTNFYSNFLHLFGSIGLAFHNEIEFHKSISKRIFLLLNCSSSLVPQKKWVILTKKKSNKNSFQIIFAINFKSYISNQFNKSSLNYLVNMNLWSSQVDIKNVLL